MYKLKVKYNQYNTVELTNNPDYNVYNIEGLDQPDSSLGSSANTTSHGSKITSARVTSRNIVIYLKLKGDIEKSRLNLYQYFPQCENVTIYFSNGRRDVSIDAKVEKVNCPPFASMEVAQISLLCEKPFFKAIEEVQTTFGDIDPLFVFPFSIPEEGIEFSAITPHIRKSIISESGVDTGAIITLYASGEVVNPIIYNISDGTYMKLNYTMQNLDTIIINTNIGEKSIVLIRNGVKHNLLGYMNLGSKWVVLSPGDNVFSYDCDSGNNNLQITFTTSVLYSGV